MISLSRHLAAALLALATAGCDTIHPFPSGPIEVRGRVVAGTGEPLSGIGVAIIEYNFTAEAVATARTDAEGRFAVRYVPERGAHASGVSYRLVVNEPYDRQYTAFSRTVVPPVELDLGTVELARNAAP